MDRLHLTFYPFLLAAIVSLVVTPVVIYFYKAFGIVVDPQKTKHPAHTHSQPVPKGGGVPVLLGVLLTAIIFLPADRHLTAILVAGVLVVVVGTLDDIFDINPYIRLMTNMAAALIIVGAGIGISFITNPFGEGVIGLDQPAVSFNVLNTKITINLLADLFALIWIPFVMNAVNWSKGLDGQLPGVVAIAALVVGIQSFRYSADVTQWPVAVLAFAVAGAYAGYLPFNFFPQKSMPGYGGGSFAGFMLATLAILSTTKVGTALVVLGIPLIDSMFIVVRRIISGKSPVWGDRGHLHHMLLDQLKWNKKQVALFYWSITAFLGVVALQLNSKQKFYTMIVVSLALGAFLLWIYFGRLLRQPGRDNG